MNWNSLLTSDSRQASACLRIRITAPVNMEAVTPILRTLYPDTATVSVISGDETEVVIRFDRTGINARTLRRYHLRTIRVIQALIQEELKEYPPLLIKDSGELDVH